jgi:hypothetical protein
MRLRIIARVLSYLNLRETWVIFFVLGSIMLNFPFIHVFSTPLRIFGIPILFLYLFVGWAISICVIYLFVKAIDHADKDKGELS